MLLTEWSRPRRFESFGGSRWSAFSKRPMFSLPLPRQLPQARAEIRESLPITPGVYGMIDAEGQLIYVGKSKRLRDRVVTYFQTRSQREKADRIAEHAVRLVWQCVPDEFGALLRELELIYRWRPRLNVQGQPGRVHRAYVCIGRGPAPRVYLTDAPNGRERDRFGPVRGGRRVRRAVQRLNDLAGLRDCPIPTPIVYAEQQRLFQFDETPRCLRFELRNCLGPCAGRCEERDYERQVRMVEAFLAGRSLAPLEMLDGQMNAAAGLRQFERAARLRDARLDLEVLHQHLHQLRQIRGRDRFVYSLSESPGRSTWYFLAGGQVVEAAAAPRDRRTAARRLRMLEAAYGDDRPLAAADHVRFDCSLLVAYWFRTRCDELRESLTPGQAMTICRRIAGRPGLAVPS